MAEAPWWKGAVIYQIYPRSFFDSDSRGTGNLKGITAKLDHVAGLGVDGIWLSPFFTSPMKDYGYDVSDYCDVDPSFGTLGDFDALVARAHALGLKVTIDQVYSHTSNEHPWFVESSASRDNPKADWYVWAEAKADGTPPNNWQASFGGPAWTWSPRRRQYYLHNFLTEQPECEESSGSGRSAGGGPILAGSRGGRLSARCGQLLHSGRRPARQSAGRLRPYTVADLSVPAAPLRQVSAGNA